MELDGSSAALTLAAGRHVRRGAAGTAGPAPVEPASRRDRSHPRLVLSRPGTPRSGLHPSRPRTLRARYTASHPAGVPRDRYIPEGLPYHGAHPTRGYAKRLRSERRPHEPGDAGSAQVHPDRTAAQAPVGTVVALGLLAGGAYAVLKPSMVTSTALVLLSQSGQAAQSAAAAAGNGGPDPYTETQEVIAKSSPVLSGALPHVRPAMSISAASATTFRSEARRRTSFR